MNDLGQRARVFATVAHRGQMRVNNIPPYEEVGYITHPFRVVSLLATIPDFDKLPDAPRLTAAGWLHDVVEDCNVTFDDLMHIMGDVRVVDLVRQVTHVSKPDDGNRAARRALDRLHVGRSDVDGATLKCADIIDNLTSPYFNSGWAHKYFAEKKLELSVLGHAHPFMLEKAWTAANAGPLIVQKNP